MDNAAAARTVHVYITLEYLGKGMFINPTEQDVTPTLCDPRQEVLSTSQVRFHCRSAIGAIGVIVTGVHADIQGL